MPQLPYTDKIMQTWEMGSVMGNIKRSKSSKKNSLSRWMEDIMVADEWQGLWNDNLSCPRSFGHTVPLKYSETDASLSTLCSNSFSSKIRAVNGGNPPCLCQSMMLMPSMWISLSCTLKLVETVNSQQTTDTLVQIQIPVVHHWSWKMKWDSKGRHEPGFRDG